MASNRVRVAALLAFAASASFLSFACGTSTFEGSADDAGTGSDGGSGADAAADGSEVVSDGGRFCTRSSPPFFCADFDDPEIRNAFIGSTDTTFFGKPDASDGGNVNLVPSGENGSQALQAFLPMIATASSTVETLSGALPTLNASEVRLQVDLRFDAADDVSGSTHVYLLTFEIDGPSDTTQYALVGYNGKLHVDVGKNSAFQTSIDLGPPPAQAAGWVPFTLDVDMSGLGMVMAKLGSVSGSSTAFANETQQNATIAFGLQTAGNSASFEVSFDNATLEVVKMDAGIGLGDAG